MREEDIYKNPVPLDGKNYLDPLKTPLDEGIIFSPTLKNTELDSYISSIENSLRLKEMEARKQLWELIARLDEMKIEDKTKPQVYTVLLLLWENISRFWLDISSLNLKSEFEFILNDYKFKPKEEFNIINKDKNEFLNIIDSEFSLSREIRILESQVSIKIIALWWLIDQIRKWYMTMSWLVIQQIWNNISKMSSELLFLTNDLKSKKDLLAQIKKNPLKIFIKNKKR